MLKSCLERIAAEKSPVDVRDSIADSLKRLSSENGDPDADQYWIPFRLASNPANPIKIRTVALDCIQKLIAHRLIRGALPIPTLKRQSSLPPDKGDSADGRSESVQHYLIDDIVLIVCAASPLSIPSLPAGEDEVQLQILKVLLTVLTTTTCELHGNTLLKIHLNSKSTINQVTAKASLTQMINLIFSRMERYSEGFVVGNLMILVLQVKIKENLAMDASIDAAAYAILGDGTLKLDPPVDIRDEKLRLYETSITSLLAFSDKVTSVDGNISNDGSKTTVFSESNSTNKNGKAGNLTKNTEAVSDDEGSPVQDMLDGVEAAGYSDAHGDQALTDDTLEQLDQPPPSTPLRDPSLKFQNNPYDPTIAYYNELLRKDVYLTFRLLCRLSMHTGHPANDSQQFSDISINSPSDELSQTSIRARVLALELILSVLNSAGPVLQSEELFVNLVRQHLCLTVARNGISTNSHLFELSISVFLMIIRLYRSRLVQEVEILINTVYLHILEMGHSSYKQKSLVLQGLAKICENPQILLDIFLNYDCNLNVVSVFERIVNVCARCAQGGRPDSQVDGNWVVNISPAVATPKGIMSGIGELVGDYVGVGTSKADAIRAQEKRLKIRALSCLVAVVNSLVEWSGQNVLTIPQIGAEGRIIVSPLSDQTAKSESPSTISLLDAIVPTNQNNPILVDRRPLNSLSLAQSRNNSTNFSPSSSPSSTIIAHQDQYSQVEELASRKQQLRQAIKLFNAKPNKGMDALQKCGFVDESVESCSKFLNSTQSLDKSAIGNYLGDHDPFNVQVMHAFIDAMTFKKTAFVDALRGLLQTFRLPGEAQKIDRIMEKFADRYCETNPDIFAKADSAYTLAYSVIMLNTDQHSSKIRHRMDKAAFIKNNRGINDNADLPESFLGEIFDEINLHEIVMEEEQAGQFAALAVEWGAGDLDNDRIRMEQYRKEMALIQKKSQQLIKAAVACNDSSRRSIGSITPSIQQMVFRSAVHADLARPMFSMASWALMATFSLLFEAAVDEAEDWDAIGDPAVRISTPPQSQRPAEPKISDLCLQGFTGAIRVASLYKMETERDAFVTSLAKLAGLSHVSELKPKNVKAIKTLIGLANILGEHLEGSWIEVMKVVSAVERLQLAWNTASNDKIASATNRSSRADLGFSRQSVDTRDPRNAIKRNVVGDVHVSTSLSGRRLSTYARADDLVSALSSGKISPPLSKVLTEISSQLMAISVDKIFSNTVGLSSNAIIHFFRALCIVSLEEVGLESSTSGQSVASTPVLIKPVLIFDAIPNSTSSSGMLSAMSGPPRMYAITNNIRFLLQKIVEIAYYNINRIRFEWSQIWRILQPHFNTVACHPNVPVATFAVDSLRQLSMKFLERDELSHYNTQHEFLKSFEWITRHNIHPAIRELILGSMSQMISARASHIKSGWKSIFVVLGNAASPPSHVIMKNELGVMGGVLTMTMQEWEKLLKASFSMILTIFKDHIDIVVKAGAFVDYVSAQAEFGLLEGSGTVYDEVVSSSLRVMGDCGKWLIDQARIEKAAKKSTIIDPHPIPNDVDEKNILQRESSVSSMAAKQLMTPYIQNNGLISEDHFFLKWFPLLSAMGRVITDSLENKIQIQMTEILFDTLKSASELFEVRYWRTIFRSIILPIFEDFSHQDARNSSASLNDAQSAKNSIIWPIALQYLVDLFVLILEQLLVDGLDLLQGVFDLILSMLAKRDEKLAMTGQVCFQQFIQRNLLKFSRLQKSGGSDGVEIWEIVTSAIQQASWITSPAELLNCDILYEESVPTSPVNTRSETTRMNLERALKLGKLASIQALSKGNVDLQSAIAPITDLQLLDFEYTIIKCGTHLELMEGTKKYISTLGILNICVTKFIDKQSALSDSKELLQNTMSQIQPGALTAINLVPDQYRRIWLRCIYDSYVTARAFNADYNLRQAIWKKRLVRQLPNLVKQETTSLASYITLLFIVYREDGDIENTPPESNLEMLTREILDVFERYADFLTDQANNARDISLWSPVVIMIFQELLNMNGWWKNQKPDTYGRTIQPCRGLKKYLSQFFKYGVRMMSAERAEVRLALQSFMELIGDEFIRFDEQ